MVKCGREGGTDVSTNVPLDIIASDLLRRITIV